MLSSTFHVHAAVKFAPIRSQKLQGMQVVRAICSSTAKNKYDDTYFLCHDTNNE